jgi:hypothetical protein
VRDPTLPQRLPPWKCRTEREKQAFLEWSLAELVLLDERLHPDDHQQSDYDVAPEVYRRHRSEQKLYSAKAAARNGDLKPLRALYREIAEFIHEPKRPRGQRRSYHNKGGVLEAYASRCDDAVESVRQLREIIWPEHYRRRKRRYDDGPTAEEIAAKFHDCTVDEVKEAMARRHRRRHRRGVAPSRASPRASLRGR